MCEAVFPPFSMNVLKALSGGLYRLSFYSLGAEGKVYTRTPQEVRQRILIDGAPIFMN
jgi:hypothetical protein